MALLHATCVAIDGQGVLLMGKPGSGKSDLALRLIDRGAMLIADDSTLVEASEGRLLATCPSTIVGKIEVRGIGIVSAPSLMTAGIALCIALDEPAERMPPDPPPTITLNGVEIPKIALSAFEASTPLKVQQALRIYGLVP